ncbi:MAG: TauD/TfdA family dioxygenase [Rhodospirillales bacterium]|nr:TauD/TfdA family dioxygenase [Rhodospirillales bacterium]
MSTAEVKTTDQAGIIQIKRVGANLGAEIGGIDLRQPLNDAQFSAVQDALVANELLIFHDQDIDSAQLKAFGARFGELTVHPFAPSDGNDHSLIKFANDADSPPFGTDVWHSDETFRAAPPMATVLCAKEVPEVGGDTVFASMTAAYEGLSDKLQDFISGLEAIHDFKPFKSLFSDSAEDRETLQRYEREYPPSIHPVVRVHPLSGRKVLFVNPQFTIAIKAMEERESRGLLDTLFHQALIPEYQFRHHWKANTIAFWDNRSTQHYAIHDYYPQRRFMERVTIKGDRPEGVGTADPATIRRAKFEAIGGADPHGGHKPLPQNERD